MDKTLKDPEFKKLYEEEGRKLALRYKTESVLKK